MILQHGWMEKAPWGGWASWFTQLLGGWTRVGKVTLPWN